MSSIKKDVKEKQHRWKEEEEGGGGERKRLKDEEEDETTEMDKRNYKRTSRGDEEDSGIKVRDVQGARSFY
ncbi:uncharacterized protein V6R79_013833 [Siganus canaliculatus]